MERYNNSQTILAETKYYSFGQLAIAKARKRKDYKVYLENYAKEKTQETRDIYRMEACNPNGPGGAQEVLRDLVTRFGSESGIENPRIYVLDDPGLLINVRNQVN